MQIFSLIEEMFYVCYLSVSIWSELLPLDSLGLARFLASELSLIFNPTYKGVIRYD